MKQIPFGALNAWCADWYLFFFLCISLWQH